VGHHHLAGADVERGAGEFVDAEKFEADAGADDVDDGIDRADFVKMDLLDGQVVDFGFGFGEAGEDFAGAFGGAGRELRFFNAIQNDRKPAVVMAFGGRDMHVRGENLAALHFFRGDGPAFETKFAQLGFDGAQIGAGVDQRAEDHVAADAGEAIEIGGSSHHEINCNFSVQR
jgi:hypothetical protein